MARRTICHGITRKKHGKRPHHPFCDVIVFEFHFNPVPCFFRVLLWPRLIESGWVDDLLFATEWHEKKDPIIRSQRLTVYLFARREKLQKKNPGTYVGRLASTFFRVFSVFRGSDSSPDWVAGDARPRLLKLSRYRCTSHRLKFSVGQRPP